MNTYKVYKVTFADNKAVSAEPVDIITHRETRKIRTVNGKMQIDWLIVSCDAHNEPLQLADKLAQIFLKQGTL